MQAIQSYLRFDVTKLEHDVDPDALDPDPTTNKPSKIYMYLEKTRAKVQLGLPGKLFGMAARSRLANVEMSINKMFASNSTLVTSAANLAERSMENMDNERWLPYTALVVMTAIFLTASGEAKINTSGAAVECEPVYVPCLSDINTQALYSADLKIIVSEASLCLPSKLEKLGIPTTCATFYELCRDKVSREAFLALMDDTNKFTSGEAEQLKELVAAVKMLVRPPKEGKAPAFEPFDLKANCVLPELNRRGARRNAQLRAASNA